MVKYSIIRTEVMDKSSLGKVPPFDDDLDDQVRKATVVHMHERRLDRRTLVGVLIGFLIIFAVGGAVLAFYLYEHPPMTEYEVEGAMDRQRDYDRFRPGYERPEMGQDHRDEPGEVGGRRGAKDGAEGEDRYGQPGYRRPVY